MKRYLVLLGVLLAAGPRPALAGPIVLSVNFCPGDPTCPVGVTDASLTFSEYTSDPNNTDTNDYLLDIVIKGATSYTVDEVSFSIGGVQTPTGYESSPNLLLQPGGSWQVVYSTLSGSSSSCTGTDYKSQEVCIQSVGGPGAPLQQGQDLHWQLLVDLAGDTLIDASTIANLRAQFLKADGSNAGILSPVPEPSPVTLIAFGIALAFLARGFVRAHSG